MPWGACRREKLEITPLHGSGDPWAGVEALIGVCWAETWEKDRTEGKTKTEKTALAQASQWAKSWHIWVLQAVRRGWWEMVARERSGLAVREASKVEGWVVKERVYYTNWHAMGKALNIFRLQGGSGFIHEDNCGSRKPWKGLCRGLKRSSDLNSL